MKLTVDNRWESSLDDFKANVNDINYKTWFKTILFDQFENGVVKLIVPSQFFYDWLLEHYITLFKKVIRKNFGTDARVEIQSVIPTDWVYKEADKKKSSVSIIKNVNESLIEDLKKAPDLIHKVTPFEFEELVALLLRKKGYDIHQTPRIRDGGKDLIAKFQSPSGDNCICFVECKKYDTLNPVGVNLIRSLYGVVESEEVNLGMIVTTSRFTSGAKEFGKLHDNKIKLKDFQDLKEWFQFYK